MGEREERGRRWGNYSVMQEVIHIPAFLSPESVWFQAAGAGETCMSCTGKVCVSWRLQRFQWPCLHPLPARGACPAERAAPLGCKYQSEPGAVPGPEGGVGWVQKKG